MSKVQKTPKIGCNMSCIYWFSKRNIHCSHQIFQRVSGPAGWETSLLNKIILWAWCLMQEVWPWRIASSLKASRNPRHWHYPPLVLLHSSEWEDRFPPRMNEAKGTRPPAQGLSWININMLVIRTNSFCFHEFETFHLDTLATTKYHFGNNYQHSLAAQSSYSSLSNFLNPQWEFLLEPKTFSCHSKRV